MDNILIQVALGKRPADMVIRNGRLRKQSSLRSENRFAVILMDLSGGR